MVLWIHIEVIDFFIFLLMEFKQYKNAKIAKFVYYEKTRIDETDSPAPPPPKKKSAGLVGKGQ